MSENNNTNNGISFSTALFLILLVLKLTKVIEWSWWWVTLPLWGGIAFAVILLLIYYIFKGNK
jgi:uncharacterized membrane protein YjfL (UPF0719 family)